MESAGKSKVLVAGATGCVGQRLVEELLNRGCTAATNHVWQYCPDFEHCLTLEERSARQVHVRNARLMLHAIIAKGEAGSCLSHSCATNRFTLPHSCGSLDGAPLTCMEPTRYLPCSAFTSYR